MKRFRHRRGRSRSIAASARTSILTPPRYARRWPDSFTAAASAGRAAHGPLIRAAHLHGANTMAARRTSHLCHFIFDADYLAAAMRKATMPRRVDFFWLTACRARLSHEHATFVLISQDA